MEVGSIIVAITSYSTRSPSIFIPSKQNGGFYFEKILWEIYKVMPLSPQSASEK